MLHMQNLMPNTNTLHVFDKTIYCIRHGIARHNILYPMIQEQAYRGKENIDTKLTEVGKKQAEKLKEIWYERNEVELVITSPLSRTLETASILFKDTKVPILAQELLREYPLGIDTPNKRASRTELIKKYPEVDFSYILSNIDPLWKEHETELPENLKKRVQQTKEWLHQRPEKIIALVGHSTFLHELLYNKFDNNETTQLQHCHPYIYR